MTSLEHAGVKGMRWGRRKGNNTKKVVSAITGEIFKKKISELPNDLTLTQKIKHRVSNMANKKVSELKDRANSAADAGVPSYNEIMNQINRNTKNSAYLAAKKVKTLVTGKKAKQSTMTKTKATVKSNRKKN